MTHIFTVPTETFEAMQGTRRHLFVKDSPKYAREDKAIIQCEMQLDKPVHRDQLEFVITMIEHGPDSKHVNGRHCLLGLYAPYVLEVPVEELNF